ncbi:hypothetical protein [Methyloglobulus sp.]|uniref:hypothetical protein n=1 Tax=Methyloglobulus sp. TaxID=2518622 RepID=UPI0032B7C51E
MAGFAKEINKYLSRGGSDFGAVFSQCCDPNLRARVVKAIYNARSNDIALLEHDELREVSTYICELEDALLRHHWGEVRGEKLLKQLKERTGFDVTAKANEYNALLEDK